MANKLHVHPAFYRRLRHYRDRIRNQEGRPQTAIRFVQAVDELIPEVVTNPGRGHSARFEAPEIADIRRISIPGFAVFALFYRYDTEGITLITIEHTAQDLPSRLAGILSKPKA